MRLLLQVLLIFTPWKFRRFVLHSFFGFELDSGSYIGASLIHAKSVHLKNGARIGHLNLIRNLEELRLGEFATVGTLNWIAGGANIDGHFLTETSRRSSLIIDDHAAVTHQHVFDCTDQIFIGKFATVAGYRSQFVTHGIDAMTSTQRCGPIQIGEYCMIGTNSIILHSTTIPNFCIVGAGALITGLFSEPHSLIAGVPGRVVKKLDVASKYFHREEGRVN